MTIEMYCHHCLSCRSHLQQSTPTHPDPSVRFRGNSKSLRRGYLEFAGKVYFLGSHEEIQFWHENPVLHGNYVLTPKMCFYIPRCFRGLLHTRSGCRRATRRDACLPYFLVFRFLSRNSPAHMPEPWSIHSSTSGLLIVGIFHYSLFNPLFNRSLLSRLRLCCLSFWCVL